MSIGLGQRLLVNGLLCALSLLAACGGGGGGGSGSEVLAPAASVSSTALSYGSERTGSNSAKQSVAVTNTGNAPLSLSGIGLTGPDAAMFALTTTCGASLAPTATCTATVTFSPTSTGAKSAAIGMQTNASSNPNIALTGTGTTPIAAISVFSVAFSSQLAGTTSALQTFNLSNTGTAAMAVTGLSLTGADATVFTLQNGCGASLAPAATCAVTVAFAPTSAGVKTAAITVQTDAASSPVVALTGTAVAPAASVSVSTMTFAGQRVGTASPAQTLIISNTGSADLSVTSVTLTGADAAAFSISNSCGASLAPLASCAATITFSPSTAGSKLASATLQSNAASNPGVALTGTATAPIASVSATRISFGSQPAGTVSAAQTLLITNTGTAPLVVSSFVVAGADASLFQQSGSTCGAPIAIGASCAVTIKFQPTAVGAKTASITAASDALSNPVVTLSATASMPPPPLASAVAIAVNVLGVAPTSATGRLTASDPTGLTLTYALAGQGVSGAGSVNASTGVTQYVINGLPATAGIATDSFMVSVSNGYSSTQVTVPVALNSDPLVGNQWHLKNAGASAFASTLPVAGNDLNVAPAWSAGYTGKGIKVGVVDTGLDAKHEDLAANVDLTHSFNFLDSTNDPTPSTAGFDHGTAVAGIIGAVAFNGKGGRGVAYKSTLRGYNLIDNFSLVNFSKSAGVDPVSADNDLFNFSFGPTANFLPSFSGAYQAIAVNSFTLRSGLGAAIVNAAGNDFVDFQYGVTSSCTLAQKYGVSCGDPAQDERRGGYTPIIVGAIDANGKHSSYSTAGSALWVSAPGGEYGLDMAYVGAGKSTYEPAIVTTNKTGCANAISPSATNALDSLGANSFAAQCQYTASMNGTSSATPNVAGVVALMLEANPRLTVRDIKYILATTAKRTDPTFAGVTASDLITGTAVELESGWTRNAAGFYFSSRYGFGAVDAGAAVAAAKAYTHYLSALKDQVGTYQLQASAAQQVVQRLTLAGSSGTFTVSEPATTVEHVIVFVNLTSSPLLACNQIELSSPAGTKSILLHAANGFTNSALNNVRFLSNAFYGEPINGTWLLRFLDFCTAGSSSTLLSTTQPQSLLLVGR